MLPPITSLQNQRVKNAAKLRQGRARQKQGRMIVDGLREIACAMEAGVELSEVFACSAYCKTEFGEPVRYGTGAHYFDARLKKRVTTFQRSHQLLPDGVVGPRTFVHLNNKAGTAGIPRLDSTTD